MHKKWLALFFSIGLAFTASSQTLFTYGKYSVDAKEFLRAYNKNNAQTATGNKTKAISDYLELYINSRLKIREAYERRYDTLPQIRSEVDNLREQIVENYMSDPTVAERLKKEAFQRSLKDIHVAHIFISYRNAAGMIDTAGGTKKLKDVMKELEQGVDFGTVAQKYSDDPSAKVNKGDIGYITVFVLPYQFENDIYNTAVGKYTATYSKVGYHIFKNLGERKAVGKIKAQQILLAIPPGSDENTKKQIAARADSLYKRILAGDDFSKLATAFSNDYISSANNGTMPDIGVGQYDAAFENVLWSLSKDGAVSRPFHTSHGWHILKRIAIKPVITDAGNKDNLQDLQQKISLDGRWKTSRDFIYTRVTEKAGFEKFPYSDDVLWALSDSLLNFVPAGIGRSMDKQSPLFKIGDSISTVANFIYYAQGNRYKQDGSGVRPYPDVLEDFTHDIMFRYYRDHLEEFNEDFRNQMSEFRDGNLFFEIMQQEVWNKAQADSQAVRNLFEKNKQNYTWNRSADAIIFFCADPASAKTAYDQVKKDPANWKKITEAFSEKIVADSGRYEWAQIPNLNNTTPTAGMLTTPLQNTTDNSASFAYILRVFPQPTQRSFEEARGAVTNDYQAMLENEWTKSLKKKYPIVIDQKVLAAISK